MATIALKNNTRAICIRIWKIGKMGFSGSKLKIIDFSGKSQWMFSIALNPTLH